MAAVSVSGMHGWGNRYYASLPGVLRLSPFQGRDLRAPFLFGCRVAVLESQIVQQAGISPVESFN
jgi:hypothetical protein